MTLELAFAGRLVVASLVIAAILCGFGYAARVWRLSKVRLGRGGPGKLASIVETTLLPDSTSLHIVRIADRYLLLGRSASHVSMLYEIPAESMASADR